MLIKQMLELLMAFFADVISLKIIFLMEKKNFRHQLLNVVVLLFRCSKIYIRQFFLSPDQHLILK